MVTKSSELTAAVFSLSKFYINDVNHASVVCQFIFFKDETSSKTVTLPNVDVLKSSKFLLNLLNV